MQQANHRPPVMLPGQLNIEVTCVAGPSFHPVSLNMQGPAGMKALHHGGATRIEVLATMLLRGRNPTDEAIDAAIEAAAKIVEKANLKAGLAKAPAPS